MSLLAMLVFIDESRDNKWHVKKFFWHNTSINYLRANFDMLVKFKKLLTRH